VYVYVHVRANIHIRNKKRVTELSKKLFFFCNEKMVLSFLHHLADSTVCFMYSDFPRLPEYFSKYLCQQFSNRSVSFLLPYLNGYIYANFSKNQLPMLLIDVLLCVQAQTKIILLLIKVIT